MKQKIIVFLSLLFLLSGLTLLAYLSFKYKTKADTTTEATFSKSLPYLSHWSGAYGDQMMELYERGHAVIPPFGNGIPQRSYDIKTLLKTKDLGLPLDFLEDQPEGELRYPPYSDIDRDPDDTFNTHGGTVSVMDSANPNNIRYNGLGNPERYVFGPKILDPLGPPAQVDLWREIGQKNSTKKMYKFMQEIYPNPPQINIVMNHEHGRMTGNQLDHDIQSARYYEEHVLRVPPEPDNWIMPPELRYNYQNRLVGDGWIERYNALFSTWRSNGINEAWKNNLKFIAYNGFGDSAYRSTHNSVMNYYSTFTTYEDPLIAPDTNNTVPRSSYYPYAWNGATPEIYWENRFTNDTRLNGNQFGSMNWVFMKAEAKQINPDFHFEFCTWDGEKTFFTPERYAAAIQYSFWITRPEIIREFTSGNVAWETKLPNLLALTKVVDRVHRNNLFQDFWLNGKLVENPVGQHPYQYLPYDHEPNLNGMTDADLKNKYGVGRWFYLYSNLDAPNRKVEPDGSLGGFENYDFADESNFEPGTTNVEIPVFSTALVKNEAPNREWLVYTYSPTQDRTGVIVTVPDFGDITVNPKQAGSFYHLKESDRSVTEITDPAATLTNLILNQKDPIVGPGSTMQFSIVGGKDQYEGDVAITGPVVWSATGGTIDQNGLFTAGQTKGKFEITATTGGATDVFPVTVNNLVSEWKFDEGSGSYISDSSGNNNACFHYQDWEASGKFGSAGKFSEPPSTDSEMGAICSSGDFNLTPREFTISAWIKHPEGNLNNGDIFGGINLARSEGYAFNSAYSTTYSPYPTKIGFDGKLSFGASVPIVAGKWHHVAGEFKSGQFIKLYFDGQKVGEKTTNIPLEITKGAADLSIGTFWNGSLDNVRFYNQALSDAEILALYNEVITSDPNLVVNMSVDKTSIQAGDTLNYTITYRNVGNTAIENAVITDNLPSNLSIISAPGSVINGQNVTWTIPVISANSSPQTLEIQCTLNANNGEKG